MISYKTCTELIRVIDNYSQQEIDRIFHVFKLTHLIHPTLGRISQYDKVHLLLENLEDPKKSGPFSDSFQIDFLNCIIENFHRMRKNSFATYYGEDNKPLTVTEIFSYEYPFLVNSLKRDGYIINGLSVKKLLPNEIEEAKTENELFSLLQMLNFKKSKGHLEQAISNHSQSNWASANGQFRTFIESLLIEISEKLVPDNKCDNAHAAIKILSQTVNPPFLRKELNEVESNKNDIPFIEGLWKRLHPEGSHPGLSDEEDSTFRYHIAIVVAHYLLRRLINR